MKHKTEKHLGQSPDQGSSNLQNKAPEWPEFGRKVKNVLESNGIDIKIVDSTTVLLEAVPVGNDFSKSKSNILFRRLRMRADTIIFVDADLEYRGSDEQVARAFSGFCRRDWRCITAHPLRGDIGRILRFGLDTVDSPLTAQVASALEQTEEGSAAVNQAKAGGILDSLGNKPHKLYKKNTMERLF